MRQVNEPSDARYSAPETVAVLGGAWAGATDDCLPGGSGSAEDVGTPVTSAKPSAILNAGTVIANAAGTATPHRVIFMPASIFFGGAATQGFLRLYRRGLMNASHLLTDLAS